MFNKIGGKIKVLATVVTIMGIICSILCGGILYLTNNVLIGLLVILLGILLSWISSFVLYGFGELIDKVTQIADNTKK